MKFINEGKPAKARLKEGSTYRWITIKTGQEIELPEEYGRNLGLKILERPKAVKSKVGRKVVETKIKIKKKDYKEKLEKIKGIGEKTAKDITNVFPTEESLRNAIKKKEKLPFRDDIEKKLKKEYGKSK